MAFLRTTVTGSIALPDGSPMPDGAKIIFTLRGWDKNVDTVAAPGPIEATVTNGAISVLLLRTASNARKTTYDVGYAYWNPDAGKAIAGHLGTIAISGATTRNIAELLALPAPLPNVPDALAQVLAATATGIEAANSANSAALLASVGTGTGFDSVAQLLASSITYGVNSITHSGQTVSLTVAAGDRWTTKEGFSYQVAASSATDHHVTTSPGGVKLYVLPRGGAWFMDAFGLPTNGTDCRVMLQRAVDAAHLAGGGRLVGKPGAIYGINVVARPGLMHRPGVMIDLNGATIQRLGTNRDAPMIEGRDSYDIGGGGKGFGLWNGSILGTGATVGVSDQGSNFLYWNATGVRLGSEGLLFSSNANGDAAQFRNAEVVMDELRIGTYGRNGISPTSGKFIYNDVRFDPAGGALPGADPGIGVDAENNHATETGHHVFNYIEAPDMTFVDFYGQPGDPWPHTIIINAGRIGTNLRGIRFRSINPLVNAPIYIGPNVELTANGTNGACVTIDNVSGVSVAGTTFKRGGATGASACFLLRGTISKLTVTSPRMDSAFVNALLSVEATAVSGIHWVGGTGIARIYLRNTTASYFDNMAPSNVTLNDATGNTFGLGLVPAAWTEIGTGLRTSNIIATVEQEMTVRRLGDNTPPIQKLLARVSFSAKTLARTLFAPVGYEAHGAAIEVGQTQGPDTADLRFFTSNGGAGRAERLRIGAAGRVRLLVCPTHADEAAATTAGLVTGDVYKTATGELRIKL